MADNARKAAPNNMKQTKKTVKHWVAVVLFAAIIVVFALWGVNPTRMGEASGGVAATVNDASISLNEYKTRVEAIEQNARIRFDQFPEAQRKAINAELHRRALDGLIMDEVMFQAAKSLGVVVSDAEVRDAILSIPFLQENGKFLKDRYRMYLQNINSSTDDFERQVRKQLVQRKMQELFVGSAMPTQEELKRNRVLADNKVNIRYVEIHKGDLEKPAFVSDADVAEFMKANKDQIEKYYKDNAIEFTKPERIQASHILIRKDGKHKDDEAKKIAGDVRKQATPANFAKLASKYSDDPLSKASGGSLGELEKGRMPPEFDKIAFSMGAGQISQPIKTEYGYDIVYVVKKLAGGTETFEQAQNAIARKLYLRSKEGEVIAKLKNTIEKSGKKEADALISKAGLKWNESGEFDLSSPVIPKLGDSKDVIAALLKHGQTPGLIPQLISMPGGGYVLVDVVSWKQVPDKTDPSAAEGIEQMVANKKASELFEGWLKEAEAKANISRNSQILAQ